MEAVQPPLHDTGGDPSSLYHDAELDSPAIVAACDLNPTEFIELDRSQVLAIVTQRDSKNSHAAIMAQLLHIPTVCNLGDDLRADYHGRTAQVDGSAGTLIVF